MQLSDGVHIRNFSIIAHIDHGKSTLADRMLEITKTVEARKMREQVLDAMELERERGITIKMQPVRMRYQHSLEGDSKKDYILNLIDTPGHIDFAYEVSRALTAVEGVVLLVDASQGVQAQTLATLEMAKSAGCVVVPAVSKIDMPAARVDDVRAEICKLLGIEEESVFLVSGKTGEGVEELIKGIIEKVPPPKTGNAVSGGRALVFDFKYSEHRGVVAFIRVTDGVIRSKDEIVLSAVNKKMQAIETGWFTPLETPSEELREGEIGYVVTGIKEPGIALVGDTLISGRGSQEALPGYSTPKPVVWASMYPESQDDFVMLKRALERLRLTDASLSFEEEGSSILGKGFRAGFLGMLHMEIVTERLKREFSIEPILTAPSITYEITDLKGEILTVYTPAHFPDESSIKSVREQWVSVSIITPPERLSAITQLLYEYEANIVSTEVFGAYGGGRMVVVAEMPLRELMRGFFDRLKSSTSGFASLSYDFLDLRFADVVRMDVLVAEEIVPAFTRIVSSRKVEEEARRTVERLKDLLPRQLFVVKIQARAKGRILASEAISAMRKDVTGYLYGGDVSRKKKLLEKQKKGKERRGEYKKMHIPQDVFMKMIRPEN